MYETCGAKTRSGAPCRNTAVMANGRCRMHGGKSLKGIASPNYKHGRYSKYFPTNLVENLQRREAEARSRATRLGKLIGVQERLVAAGRAELRRREDAVWTDAELELIFGPIDEDDAAGADANPT